MVPPLEVATLDWTYICLSVFPPFHLHPLFSADKDLRQQVVALLRKKNRAAAARDRGEGGESVGRRKTGLD